MRAILVATLVGLSAASLRAAPVPAAPAPVETPPEVQAEAIVFARQLLAVCDQVAERYVRPVDRHDLVAVAATGLYEAAQLPPPPGLRRAVAEADTEEALVGVLAATREATTQAP